LPSGAHQVSAILDAGLEGLLHPSSLAGANACAQHLGVGICAGCALLCSAGRAKAPVPT
jgi:hypothetical protein